eukprot:CAMPEP_0177783538 /NCGR_PEP_ID=MMETSP0491_2-20121128/19168_1 /TAXON_ID=63592 /ORGANISM="Tetraselmis chuii, Strain PLY429" /LENGTH=53 /DNA_ID=CAMNT_0019304139 /DNA_START=104 /DNA_END=261 /DNA_ORIENTATION=-
MGTQSSIRRKTGRYRSTWSTTLKVDPVTFEGLLEIKDTKLQQKGLVSKATRLT